jgi:hypothetical protein
LSGRRKVQAGHGTSRREGLKSGVVEADGVIEIREERFCAWTT